MEILTVNAHNTTLTGNASAPDLFALNNLGYVVHIDPAQDPEGWYWTQTRGGQADVVSSQSYFERKDLAWADAEVDARAHYPDAWFQPYYLTRFQVDVMSETDAVPTLDLATTLLEISAGDYSGRVTVKGHWRLSAPEAAAELESQGTSADFFMGLGDIEQRSSFMPPSPEKAFAQGARALLRRLLPPANAGRPALLNAKEIEELLKEADAILTTES